MKKKIMKSPENQRWGLYLGKKLKKKLNIDF